jgi:hypothetical protein
MGKCRKFTQWYAGTHDVYQEKGVTVKIRKTFPLFSIGYLEQNLENYPPEPTISYDNKRLNFLWERRGLSLSC